MPFNPDGSFGLLFEFGTGTAPDNQFPPQVGDDLTDIADSLNLNTIFGSLTATITATFANVTVTGGLVVGSPTGGNLGAGTINVASTIAQNNHAVFVQTQNATGGVTFTTFDHGTVSSGTIFPSAAACLKQQVTNNGAFTVSSSSLGVGDVELLIINAASAGTITFSGFTKQFTGDALNLTNGNAFAGYLYGFAGSRTAYIIKALQ